MPQGFAQYRHMGVAELLEDPVFRAWVRREEAGRSVVFVGGVGVGHTNLGAAVSAVDCCGWHRCTVNGVARRCQRTGVDPPTKALR